MKISSIRFPFLILVFGFWNTNLMGQAGELDTTFGVAGRVTTPAYNGAQAYSIALEQDGKIIVGGQIKYGSGNFGYGFGLLRYNANGMLDESFGTEGLGEIGFATGPSFGYSVAIQPDGKILLGGCTSYDFELARYNNNGTLDDSFGMNGLVSNEIGTAYSMALQGDGKIIMTGDNFNLARYNTDGTLDSSFNENGIVEGDTSGSAFSVVIQAPDKIIAAGTISGGIGLRRYHADGSVDSTFGVNGKVVTQVGYQSGANSCLVLSNGKILIVGFSNETEYNFTLANYNSNGTIDSSFDTDGVAVTHVSTDDNQALSMAIQPDGKIIVVGPSSDSTIADFTVVRYNSNGSLDASFGNNGISKTDFSGSTDIALSVTMQPDGKIIVAGSSTFSGNLEIALARYLSDLNVGIISLTTSGNSLFIYPNPIQDKAVLKYALLKDEIINIRLLDISGVLVQTFINGERRKKGKQEEVLRINKLVGPGAYVLQISNDTYNLGIKVIIK
ncbi:MAG: T9SS type A sorting domain-containing protein [Chitinophagales bacterium]